VKKETFLLRKHSTPVQMPRWQSNPTCWKS